MMRLALIAWLALCGIANAQLSGGVGGFPGPGTVHSAGGVTCSSSEGNAFLARLTGSPNNTHKTAYCTLIDGLVTDGVWTKLDALYMFAADSSANGLLNLVSATGNATNVGATFTVDTGFAGNGSSTYINTTVDPTATTKFTQNSAHFSVWGNLASPSNTGAHSGWANGAFTVETRMMTGDTTTAAVAIINDATQFNSGGTNNGTKHNLVNRSASNARQFYQNGASVASDAIASVAPPSGVTFFIGARNNNGSPGNFTNQQFLMVSIGGNLAGGSDAANFYARTHTYLQTIAGIP